MLWVSRDPCCRLSSPVDHARMRRACVHLAGWLCMGRHGRLATVQQEPRPLPGAKLQTPEQRSRASKGRTQQQNDYRAPGAVFRYDWKANALHTVPAWPGKCGRGAPVLVGWCDRARWGRGRYTGPPRGESCCASARSPCAAGGISPPRRWEQGPMGRGRVGGGVGNVAGAGRKGGGGYRACTSSTSRSLTCWVPEGRSRRNQGRCSSSVTVMRSSGLGTSIRASRSWHARDACAPAPQCLPFQRLHSKTGGGEAQRRGHLKSCTPAHVSEQPASIGGWRHRHCHTTHPTAVVQGQYFDISTAGRRIPVTKPVHWEAVSAPAQSSPTSIQVVPAISILASFRQYSAIIFGRPAT